MRSLYNITILLLLALNACTGSTIINHFEDLGEQGWSVAKVITMDFEIEDTTHYYQLFANVKVDASFQYSNFFMQADLIDPDGKSHVIPIEVKITDPAGKWLGSGLGDTKTYQELIGKKRAFNKKGNYTVILKQNTRNDPIEHVLSAGIKITKEEEIF